MIKHLTKHGNSRAIVIGRSILELLDIGDDTPLSLTTDGNCLVVTPVRDPGRGKRFRAAAAWVHHRYDKAFKRLAE